MHVKITDLTRLLHLIKAATDKCYQRAVTLALLCISGCLLVTGCTLGGKDTILPQEGASMQEVYEAHFKRSGVRHANGHDEVSQLGPRGPGLRESNLAGFTREAHNEIDALFPQLPNPTLVMYVFPHLTRQGQPIPGYATSFTLYEKAEVALPGESEGRQ